MPKSRSSRPNRLSQAERHAYWNVVKQPLQILAFLLPLIVTYEVSLALLLRSEHGVLTNNAHKTLLGFFAAFGIAPESGFYMGGIAVVVVLLVWHFLNRDPWRVDVAALGLMALESLVLTLPLLVMGQLITRLVAAGGIPSTTLEGLSLWSKLAISLGAGLYEELLFRMMLIAVLHTLFVDVGRLSYNLGAAIAVAIAAAAFAWYHPLHGPGGQFSTQKLAFFFLAGLYFGAVYVARGFGIVVGVHALYDVVTFSLLASAGE